MTRGIDVSNAIYLLVMEAVRHYARPSIELTHEVVRDYEIRTDAHRDMIARLIDEVES